jgi:hypothetical protein
MPAAPKLVVGRASFQEVREFIDIVEFQVSAKQVPQQVQRAIRETVHCGERGKRKRSDFAHAAPVPELVQFVDLDSLDLGGPQAVMQLQGYRHPRIVVILRPPPSCLADHGGQVIRSGVRASRGFKTQLGDGLLGAADVLRRAVDIDVVLRAILELIDVMRPVRDALQDAEFDLAGAKCGHHFTMSQ